MSDEKGYNGWTNYETWNVKLWMDNEQRDHRHYAAMAQEAYDDATAEKNFTREERAALNLAGQIKDEYENAMADILEKTGTALSVWADLLGDALSEVNWQEIAKKLIEDVNKEEAEESADAE